MLVVSYSFRYFPCHSRSLLPVRNFLASTAPLTRCKTGLFPHFFNYNRTGTKGKQRERKRQSVSTFLKLLRFSVGLRQSPSSACCAALRAKQSSGTIRTRLTSQEMDEPCGSCLSLSL